VCGKSGNVRQMSVLTGMDYVYSCCAGRLGNCEGCIYCLLLSDTVYLIIVYIRLCMFYSIEMYYHFVERMVLCVFSS